MIGPGKYDDVCTEIRERFHAKGVILIIDGGDRGHGFSAQLDIAKTFLIPKALRKIADDMETDFIRQGIK